MMIVGSEVANLSSIPVRPNYRWRRTIPPDYMKPNLRRCLSCRQVAHKDKFWRVVRVYPKRTIQLDKGMGRSAYLCPRESCLRAAQKKDRLGRVLRAQVPEEVYQTLWQRLKTPRQSS